MESDLVGGRRVGNVQSLPRSCLLGTLLLRVKQRQRDLSRVSPGARVFEALFVSPRGKLRFNFQSLPFQTESNTRVRNFDELRVG